MSNEQIADLRRKADQGDAEAQFGLGLVYTLGHGVPQDYAKAREWYEQAAAQGYADAQALLGVLYALGQGVPQDYVRAYMWSDLAAVSGDEAMVLARDLVASRMTPAQIAEAQQLSQQCQTRQFKGC